MRVLVNGVMSAEEGGGANVETLLVVDFFRADEAGRVAGAGGGNGRVEGMREGVTKSYPWRSGRDELAGISRLKHARLCSHDGVSLYTPAGKSRGVSPKKNAEERARTDRLEQARSVFREARERGKEKSQAPEYSGAWL